jgi:hypothetical protein
MKLLLAGGSGRLGQILTAALVKAGHSVVVLSRTPSDARHAASSTHDPVSQHVREVAWTADGTVGPWISELEDADVVVNLAGAGIADARWTPTRKDLLRASRVLSTRSLVGAMRQATRRPPVFIQHCAVGYYGSSLSDRVLDESHRPGADFFGQLATAWEAEAAPIAELGSRLVVVRAGVVLERGGGALPKMLMPFRFFVGGPVASGRQYLSWIHVEDWVRLMLWTIGDPKVSGPINATAPHPVTNAEFSSALGRAAHRPSWAPVPAFVLRVLFGELADSALVNGQRVIPKRALELGFTFEYPTIDAALSHLLGRQ